MYLTFPFLCYSFDVGKNVNNRTSLLGLYKWLFNYFPLVRRLERTTQFHSLVNLTCSIVSESLFVCKERQSYPIYLILNRFRDQQNEGTTPDLIRDVIKVDFNWDELWNSFTLFSVPTVTSFLDWTLKGKNNQLSQQSLTLTSYV